MGCVVLRAGTEYYTEDKNRMGGSLIFIGFFEIQFKQLMYKYFISDMFDINQLKITIKNDFSR
jgi:hypothetical protein